MAQLRPRGRQASVVYLKATGHNVVLGTAGTGKTVMAMLRARYLADPSTQGNGPVLLVTYNNALVAYIRKQQGGRFPRVTVETYAKFACGYLDYRGLMPDWDSVADDLQYKNLIKAAIKKVASAYPASKFFEHGIEFFKDEISWISGMGIESLESYIKITRVGRGRGSRLSANQKSAVWQILEVYRSLRSRTRYKYDWHDIASTVREQLVVDKSPRMYKHIVIDEGQDLTPEMIRSLVGTMDPSGSITFFGDYAQQIYGQGLSWRSCGLIVSKTEKFADNYRNTAAIAKLAIALSRMPGFGEADEDLVEPIAPTAAGSPPTIVACRDMNEEIAVVQRRAAALSTVNTVAVLGRTWAEAEKAVAGLNNARRLKPKENKWDDKPGISYGAYHSAKGLEFDVVIMPFCGATKIPLPEVVSAFGERDAISRESKLLYVAITRARSELILTYNRGSERVTPLLPTNPELYLTVTP